MHRHVWKVIKQTTQEAPIEALLAAGLTKAKGLSIETLYRGVIVTYRCEACGTEKVERV